MLFDSIHQRRWFEAVVTIGGRIISVFLVIGTTKFLTSFLDERAFGSLALYSVCATLPATFLFGPLGQGIIRYLPVAREREEFSTFHAQYRAIFCSGSLAVLLAAFAVAVVCLLGDLRDWAAVVALLALLSVSATYNTYCSGLQNAARKRFTALGLETGERILQQGLAVLLLWRVSRDPKMVFVGQFAASLIFVAINRVYFRKTFPEVLQPSQTPQPLFSFRGPYQKDILRYAWPFIVFGAAFWLQSSSERWSLELYQSTEVVAHYAVLNQLGFQSLSLVFGSISFFLSPILFSRAGGLREGQFENANRLNNAFLLFNVALTVVMAFSLWIFDVQVIRWLTSAKYLSVAKYLPWMVLVGGVFNFAQIYANRFMVALATDRLLAPKLISSCVGIVLNVLAARSHSIVGMIAAVGVTNIIYLSTQVYMWKQFARGSTRT